MSRKAASGQKQCLDFAGQQRLSNAFKQPWCLAAKTMEKILAFKVTCYLKFSLTILEKKAEDVEQTHIWLGQNSERGETICCAPEDLAEKLVTTRSLHLTCLCSANFSKLGNNCLHWPQIRISGVSVKKRKQMFVSQPVDTSFYLDQDFRIQKRSGKLVHT